MARKGLRDKLFSIPSSLRMSLRRWLKPGILSSSVPFRPPPSFMDIYTDASIHEGCVQTFEGHHFRGSWSRTLRHCHINILELVAIYLRIRRPHVCIRCDNTTAVNCLNRQRSARSKPLNSWGVSILHQLKRKDIAISVFHGAGVQNVIADRMSRVGPSSSEWTLDRGSFECLCDKLGKPQIDMLATRYITRLREFVFPIMDARAVAVDSFTVNWNQWSFIYFVSAH